MWIEWPGTYQPKRWCNKETYKKCKHLYRLHKRNFWAIRIIVKEVGKIEGIKYKAGNKKYQTIK